MQSLQNKRILVGVTGGIAAYKAPDVVRRLRYLGAEVKVIMTRGACVSRVAVVKLLFAFGCAVLLWRWSCSLLYLPCCCGEAPACFLISRVAVVQLLVAFRIPVLLW